MLLTVQSVCPPLPGPYQHLQTLQFSSFVLTEIITMLGRIKSTLFFPLLFSSLLLSDLAVSSLAFLFWQGDTTNFYNQFPSLDRIILVSDETGFAWCSEMPFRLHRRWDPLLGFSSAAGFYQQHKIPPVSNCAATRGTSVKYICPRVL